MTAHRQEAISIYVALKFAAPETEKNLFVKAAENRIKKVIVKNLTKFWLFAVFSRLV